MDTAPLNRSSVMFYDLADISYAVENIGPILQAKSHVFNILK